MTFFHGHAMTVAVQTCELGSNLKISTSKSGLAWAWPRLDVDTVQLVLCTVHTHKHCVNSHSKLKNFRVGSRHSLPKTTVDEDASPEGWVWVCCVCALCISVCAIYPFRYLDLYLLCPPANRQQKYHTTSQRHDCPSTTIPYY